MAPYLRPTLTQRLRAFLQAHDPIEPWSTWPDTLDRLHALLIARRDDAVFWAELQALVDDLQQDVQRGRLDGLPAPEAEVLSDADLGSVMAELHEALGSSHTAKAGSMHLMLAGRSAALAACITLIAAAWTVGCNRTDSAAVSPDSSVIAPDPVATPVDAGSPDALVELFRDASPDVIAAQLEAMLEAGADAAPEASVAATPPKPTAKPAPPRPRPPVTAVPRYKGVTF